MVAPEGGRKEATLYPETPNSENEMMGFRTSALESIESEEALEAPGPPPEPRAPEPRAPEPEPGLDLSLSPSPLPESPKQRKNSPGQRKGRRGGSRRGRQVSNVKARPPARRAPGISRSPFRPLLPGSFPTGAALSSPVRAAAGGRCTGRRS